MKEKVKSILKFFLDFIQPNSSLTLQMFLYFDRTYSVLFFLFELILYIYKGTELPFPPGCLAPEIIGIFFFLILQIIRLHLATIGNKTEISMYLMYSIFLSVPVIVIYVYYLRYQVYSLAFDVSLASIGLVFLGIEVIVSVIALITIRKNDTEN